MAAGRWPAAKIITAMVLARVSATARCEFVQARRHPELDSPPFQHIITAVMKMFFNTETY
jgi:hypothetical protein